MINMEKRDQSNKTNNNNIKEEVDLIHSIFLDLETTPMKMKNKKNKELKNPNHL